LQVLSKIVKVRTLVYTLDQFELQKPLSDEFPQAQMIFTPTEKLFVKAKELTCDLGYDMIIDFGGTISD